MLTQDELRLAVRVRGGPKAASRMLGCSDMLIRHWLTGHICESPKSRLKLRRHQIRKAGITKLRECFLTRALNRLFPLSLHRSQKRRSLRSANAGVQVSGKKRIQVRTGTPRFLIAASSAPWSSGTNQDS